MELYPLTFEPIFKDKIWGGQKIKSVLGKDFGTLPNCGESWEISGVDGNISIVANGMLKGKDLKSIIDQYQEKLVGHKVYEKFGNEFPLLIKFIDANDDLSIQVHPDDALAQARHGGFGKTEMWYILQADEGAKLISGFNEKIDKATYLKYFNSGKLTELLKQVEVNDGDVFFLPAGRVHTIGRGLLLAEIQQTSDITYRIFDFDRVDDKGNKRELHVEQAIDAINFDFYGDPKTHYTDTPNKPVGIVDCEYFTVNKINCSTTMHREYAQIDSFVVLICTSGQGELHLDGSAHHIKAGETVLIPAEEKGIRLETQNGFSLLESYINLP